MSDFLKLLAFSLFDLGLFFSFALLLLHFPLLDLILAQLAFLNYWFFRYDRLELCLAVRFGSFDLSDFLAQSIDSNLDLFLFLRLDWSSFDFFDGGGDGFSGLSLCGGRLLSRLGRSSLSWSNDFLLGRGSI